jgi:hypothetical protein
MSDTVHFYRIFGPNKWPKPDGGVYSDRTFLRFAKRFGITLIPCGTAGPLVDPDDAEDRIKAYGKRLQAERAERAERGPRLPRRPPKRAAAE